MIDQTISHYLIVKKIGEGGMGEVYLAEDTKLHRKVALKFLPLDAAPNQEQMRRFLQEARAAAKLHHGNIAHIYEIGEADGKSFIAMEYVEGQAIDALIKGRPMETDEIIRIGIDMAAALDEAHNAGITHRDIKPSNIMLTPRGQVKVLDFGLAKVTKKSSEQTPDDAPTQIKTSPGVVLGTLEYMSPEQALGREVDHRSDIFSLGLTLYEMATGKRPFKGATAPETLDRLLHAQPDPGWGSIQEWIACVQTRVSPLSLSASTSSRSELCSFDQKPLECRSRRYCSRNRKLQVWKGGLPLLLA